MASIDTVPSLDELHNWPDTLHRVSDDKTVKRTLIEELASKVKSGRVPSPLEDGVYFRYAVRSYAQVHPRNLTKEFAEIQSKIEAHFKLQAKEYGCGYYWLDEEPTSANTEPQFEERVRSHFRHYANAYVCFVYIADPESPLDPWYRRGWTIPEILAPQRVKFYSHQRKPLFIESKFDINRVLKNSNGGLIDRLHNFTRIHKEDLENFRRERRDVRRILFWAHNKQTILPVDIVYCLLGLFDIHEHLHINYHNVDDVDTAFHDLQLALLYTYDDRTLFLFDGEASHRNSMFSRGPECFSQQLEMGSSDTDTSGPPTRHIESSNRYLTFHDMINYPILQGVISPGTQLRIVGLGSVTVNSQVHLDAGDFFGVLGTLNTDSGPRYFGLILRPEPYDDSSREIYCRRNCDVPKPLEVTLDEPGCRPKPRKVLLQCRF
ncbi:hypothetical protein ONZ45_g6463 [Pleurotus djamor]|nr:hypothetical protein ONZ45_g6463 [Pleurotus djamor]